MKQTEELLLTIASLKWENEKLRTERRHAQQLLGSLEALLSVSVEDDPFASAFASLGQVFDFEHAMVLAEADDDTLECAVAEPEWLAGTRWQTGAFFRKVMAGKVASVFSHARIAEWGNAADLGLHHDQPALYIPLRIRNRRGILALLRALGAAGFDRNDVALAERFSVLASLALASMTARQIIDENRTRAVAAEEASRAKTLFLANMSHELRTPLNAIIGFAELIESEVHGPIGEPSYCRYVRDIRESGTHLLEIINNFLLLSRIEAGKHVVNLQQLHLSAEVKTSIRLLQAAGRERNVALRVDDIAEEDLVSADELGLRQILVNLIDNAIKFSAEGDGVRVRLERSRETLHLLVEDNGCGIPPETLTKLGQPFTQAENSYARAHQGTGLGLAICYRLAESIGGAITIDSEVDKGTTVRLSLPRACPVARPGNAQDIAAAG